jgi:hypothetical protein
MTRIPLANPTFVRLVALLFMSALTVVSSHAQQDFEIMVNGPWQFVVAPDPSGTDRLFVVAPYHPTHAANIWSGTNASMMNWYNSVGKPAGELVLSQNGANPNIYTLDFPQGYSQQNLKVIHGKREAVYQSSSRNVQNVLHPPNASTQRYAISLPLPYSVRTYTGGFGPGIAEAEIGDATLVDGLGTPAGYATWTVLHYGLTAVPPSMDVKLDQTSQPSVTVGKDAYGRYGISIALVEAPFCDDSTNTKLKYYPADCPNSFPTQHSVPYDDPECDTVSGLSFSLASQLWGLNENALYPREEEGSQGNSTGRQIVGSYDFDECPLNGANNVQLLETRQQQVAEHYFAIADLSAKTSALETFFNADAKGKSRRSLREQSEQTIPGDFTAMSSDLNTIFDNHVPLGLSNELYCACSAASRQCNLQGNPSSNCNPKEKAGAYLEAFEDSIAKYSAPNNKGSSDCHAAQISINGAIKLQP